MKGYYIFVPVDDGVVGEYSGVEKKIRNFCKVLNETIDTELHIVQRHQINKSRIMRILIRWMPWTAVGHNWQKMCNNYEDADFLYIRKAEHDYSFIKFLKEIKKNNPKIKILYELPTYPYEGEKKVSVKNFPIYAKDRVFRRMLKKYVDRIVTFYDQKKIFDIKTISVINGYSFNNAKCSIMTYGYDNDINLIEVSTTAFWHGYDRMLEGLHLYYKNGGSRNVNFHMVGPIMDEHRKMVSSYSLEKHVILHGKKSGDELDKIYSKCSIGVDVLGGHRKNYPISSSLKSREYADKGMPIITSSPIDYLPLDYKYQLVCSYDDEPIDIEQIIEFYDTIFKDELANGIHDSIYKFAVQNCDFHETIKPIISYLQGRS